MIMIFDDHDSSMIMMILITDKYDDDRDVKDNLQRLGRVQLWEPLCRGRVPQSGGRIQVLNMVLLCSSVCINVFQTLPQSGWMIQVYFCVLYFCATGFLDISLFHLYLSAIIWREDTGAAGFLFLYFCVRIMYL